MMLRRGNVVFVELYGKVMEGVVLRFDNEDSIMVGMKDFEGHNGEGQDVYVPQEFLGHCWWIGGRNIVSTTNKRRFL